MVDKLVAKFKKLVNDDKRRLNIEESNEIEDTVIEKPKKKKKLIIDDDEMQNKFTKGDFCLFGDANSLRTQQQ